MSTQTIDAPRLVLDVPENEYHAGPELSHSGAKSLLRSPAKYLWEREHPVHKDVFDVGTAAHALVLGTPLEIVVVDADDWRTKVAKEAKAEAHAAGQTPLLRDTWAEIQAMRGALMRHRTARSLLEREGHSEASIYWTDSATGVPLRCRFDRLTTNDGRALGIDYKSTNDASPRGFAKSVASFEYVQQDPWYLDGLIALGYEDPSFLFIAQEKSAPYLPAVYELRPGDREIGREKNALARQMWRDCTEADVWPAYSEDVQFLDLPRWYGFQHEMETS